MSRNGITQEQVFEAAQVRTRSSPMGGLWTEPIYGSPEVEPIVRIEAPHLNAQPSPRRRCKRGSRAAVSNRGRQRGQDEPLRVLSASSKHQLAAAVPP